MNTQQRILVVFRRGSVLAAVLGAAYLVMRFDIVTLPESSCCPLSRFEPGERLIVDRRPRGVFGGDAVLVQTQGGTLHLTRVDRVRAEDGRLWCVTDREGCPGFNSDTAGWVDPRAARGRVLLAWAY